MEKIWDTSNRDLSLTIEIKCVGKCLFRVVASDLKPNSKYADRTIEVDGFRSIYLSFPITPKKMRVNVDCIKASGDDKNFIVNIKEKQLKTYDIYLSNEVKEFLDLAVYFSQVAGFETASKNGRIFQTSSKRFNIKYYPIIKDFRTGMILNTPARIGHRSGIIDISKKHMDSYTIAMRMVILLHEFSHVFKNPKMGLEISNEIGADINALYVYLGLGFSKVDAIYVFANVFLKAQTKGNIQRMEKIMEYIKKFEDGEFAKPLI